MVQVVHTVERMEYAPFTSFKVFFAAEVCDFACAYYANRGQVGKSNAPLNSFLALVYPNGTRLSRYSFAL